MGKQLVIKGADFSANALSIVCVLSKGSINAQSHLIIDSSNIKFRLANTIHVASGKQIIISGFGAPVDGIVPGYSYCFYNSNLEPIDGSYGSVGPVNGNTPLGDIVVTNNTGVDAEIMVAFGFVTVKQPSNFNVDDYRESYEGKITAMIETV